MRAARVVADPASWDGPSLAFGVLSIALVLGGRRLHRLVPGALLAVVAGVIVSRTGGTDVAVIGPLPEGLPGFDAGLPWHRTADLLLPGVVIAVVGFSEAASIARRFATIDRARWDPDRELVGQGLANLGAGLVGGFAVGGSFGRSGLGHASGARSRWSGALTGVVVLAVLPFIGVLEDVPVAVLAGIVVAAVVPLIDPAPLIRFARHTRLQLAVAVTTMAATFAFAPRVERAVLVGVVAAALAHLWRELPVTLDTWMAGRELHLRPRGVLYYASAPKVQSILSDRLADHPEARAVVFHLDGLGRVDVTGAVTIEALVDDLVDAGVEVTVVDVPPQSIKIIRRTIGERVPVVRALDSGR